MSIDINNQTGLQIMREVLLETIAKIDRGEVDGLILVGLTRPSGESQEVTPIGHTYLTKDFSCDMALPVMLQLATECVTQMHDNRCEDCREADADNKAIMS